MSDLEAVMERLLTDPLFQSALARNPDAALAGYTLSAEDRELLGVPVVTGSGEDRTVELRTTKSGVVGMLGPVVSAFGVVAGSGNQSMGFAPGSNTLGSAPGSGSSGDTFGHAPLSDGSNSGTESFGTAGPRETFGTVTNAETVGAAPSGAGLENYSTRVDVDGDGSWDAHTLHARDDGGVDIHADMNHDGIVDFIGHDDNRDGLVDSADYDTNRDGVMDTRMYDDNRDGWMDRSEPIPPKPGEAQTFGNAPGG